MILDSQIQNRPCKLVTILSIKTYSKAHTLSKRLNSCQLEISYSLIHIIIVVLIIYIQYFHVQILLSTDKQTLVVALPISEIIPLRRRLAPAHFKKAVPQIFSSQFKQALSPPPSTLLASLNITILRHVATQLLKSHITFSTQQSLQSFVNPTYSW